MDLENLPGLVSFADLKKTGIVCNRVTLKRWIESQGFPPGISLGPNSRRWHKPEIVAWLSGRPPRRRVEGQPAEPDPAGTG